LQADLLPQHILASKSFLRTVSPMMQTAARERISLSLNCLPVPTDLFVVWKYWLLVPVTWVVQFWLPNIAWTDCDDTGAYCGYRADFIGNGLDIGLLKGTLPVDWPGPNLFPGLTMSRLQPMLAICC
jgi:hypothetical protein